MTNAGIEPSTSDLAIQLNAIKNQIEDISQLPLAEHGAKFNQIHQELTEALMNIEN